MLYFRPIRPAIGACFGRPTFGFGRAALAVADDDGSDSFGSFLDREKMEVPVRGLPMAGFRIAES